MLCQTQANFKLGKITLLILILACFSLLVNFLNISHAQPSTDAIAIRVFENPNHYSAQRWYNGQGFTGSPQALIVDGYEAVRDGRTVYVNAANIISGYLYTNIYLISYNQEAEKNTKDIFAQVLLSWKFNTNLPDYGVCQAAADVSCLLDSDCPQSDYCLSDKAKVVRDTIRLARLYDIDYLIEKYQEQWGSYPKLAAGSYYPHITISVWPSWQKVLAQALASHLPIDPLNRLDDCSGANYHPITCWDETAKAFAWPDDLLAGDLLDFNYVFLYQSDALGASFHLCAYSETGMFYGEDEELMCNSGCMPICIGQECGPDNCGGECPPGCNTGETCVNGQCQPGCNTGPGCLAASLNHAHTIGGYCAAGSCYECDIGYSWEDPDCTCTPSCSGEAGCQENLANGMIVPGVCCGGEYCYRCGRGYSWNGAVCVCEPTCHTGIGCRSSLLHGEIVWGNCCGIGNCYVCADGYAWNGSNCESGCDRTCTTGPGCRTVLTNGFMVSGDCCGYGDCFDCRPGFSWNENLAICEGDCTINCTTEPGCWESLDHGHVVYGDCCGYGYCHACDDDYVWLNGQCGCPSVVLNPIPNATIYALPSGHTGELYFGPVQFNRTATRISPEAVTYSLSNNPSWLVIDSNTGHMQGTQTANTNNTYTITVTAVNSCGSTDSEQFILTVLPNGWCGDNVLQDPPEDCDGANLGGADCVSEGHSGGTLACDTGCSFDDSDCDDCCRFGVSSFGNCEICGESCTPTCATAPGCRASLTHGHTVAGGCCGAGSCYECDSGYEWNESECVVTGDVYYVDNGGSGSGTISDPWSVAQLNSQALSNNAVIIFKSEVIYTTAVRLSSCRGANIILRASEDFDGDWGDGVRDKDNGLPTWDGNTIVGRPFHISNSNLVNLTIRYIKISGTEGQTGWGSMMSFAGAYEDGTITVTGCVFDGEASANYTYPTNAISTGNQECWTTSFVIQDCEFKDLLMTDAQTSCTEWTVPNVAEDRSLGRQGNTPIILYWQAGTPNTGTILITRNKFTNIVGDMVHILAYQGSSFEISNNWFENWYENAIDLKGVTNVKISNNYFKEGLPGGVDKDITMATMGAIIMHPGTAGGTYYGNDAEISGNYFTNIKGSGMALTGFSGGDGPVVKHNYFKDVTRPLYLPYADTLKFFGNVVNITPVAQTYDGLNCCETYTYYGCGSWSSDYSYVPLYWYDVVQRIQFYNNTVYVNSSDFYNSMFFHGSLDGSIPSHIKNNIFVVTEDAADYYPVRTGDATTDIDDSNFTHNIFANLGGAQNALRYKGTTYAETQQANFLTDHPNCIGTLFTDPGLTDPVNSNFSLSSGAGAIDAGVNLGALYSSGLDWVNCNWTADPRFNTLAATLPQDAGLGWEIGAVVYDDGAVAVDNTAPIVSAFSATSGSAIINWTVTDTGGSHLDRIEIWRAPDNNGSPGAWGELASLRQNIANLNLDFHSGEVTDYPSVGTWWYGLHAVDQANPGNCINERNRGCTSGISNGQPEMGPDMISISGGRDIPLTRVDQVDASNQAQWWIPVTKHGEYIYMVYNAPHSVDTYHHVKVARIDSSNNIETGFLMTDNNTRWAHGDDNGHDQPSIAIDGDGYIHVWASHHNDDWRYFRSSQPHDVATMMRRFDMPGEVRLTYPVPKISRNGDIYLLGRDTFSNTNRGQGKMWHYDNHSKAWRHVATIGIDPSATFYPGELVFDGDGNIHFVFSWTSGAPGMLKHFPSYLKYDPGADRFYSADGTEINIPIDHNDSRLHIQGLEGEESFWHKSEGLGLRGSGKLALDSNNNPVSVYLYRVEDNTPYNLRRAKWTGSNWDIETIYNAHDTGIVLSKCAGITDRGDRVYYSFKYDEQSSRMQVAQYTNTWTHTALAPGNPVTHFSIKDTDDQDILYLSSGQEIDSTKGYLYIMTH